MVSDLLLQKVTEASDNAMTLCEMMLIRKKILRTFEIWYMSLNIFLVCRYIFWAPQVYVLETYSDARHR